MKWDALLNFKELLKVSFLKWMFTLQIQVRDCNSGDKMKLTKYVAFKRIILLESFVTTSWSSN